MAQLQEDIEIQLWAYIDGSADAADRQRIAGLISTDANWQRIYNELLAFQEECISGLELDQPSMRFTKNVMEAIATTHVAPAAHKYINHTLLRGIAALFIISIIMLLGYTFLSVDWSVKSTMNLPKADFTDWHVERLFSGPAFYVFAGINVVLGLVLTDMLLRRKIKEI